MSSILDASQALGLELPPRARAIPRAPGVGGDVRVITPVGPPERIVRPETDPDPMDNAEDRKIFHLSPPPVYRTPNPRELDVVFVGSGISGMTFGIMSQWRLKNVNVVIYEKNASFGGTWFENRYPGCRCDVQSHIYQFRFETFDWSEAYAQWDEIFHYHSYVFAKYGLSRLVQFRHAVVGADYDEERAKWRVTVEKTDEVTGKKERFERECDVLVNGTGVLNRPKWPDTPGAELFKGELVHTAQWDESKDSVDGKVVGVIGNGSTGIQVVQSIGSRVKHMDHYVRTPTYMQAYLEGGVKLSPQRRGQFRDPAFTRQFMRDTYMNREKYWVMFTSAEHKLNKLVVKRALEYLEKSVKDPELRAKLTPHFAYGCRRPIFSDDYYPTIQRPNVSLRREPIKRFWEKGLVLDLGDGREEMRELDMIICATGFAANWVSKFMPVRGRERRLLADDWASHPEAYRTLTVNGFPNYFMILGPNTPPTHNSLIISCEQQCNYVMQMIHALQHNPLIKSIEVKLEAQRAFAKEAQDWLKTNSVWNVDCGGWYRYKNGYTVQWPGPALHMIDSIHSVDWRHYSVEMWNDPSSYSMHTPWTFKALDKRELRDDELTIQAAKL
ncbi:FAD/NAD(P)-binding domain-containing protein [Gonapodya prolifera JEL478]|uniref:L-ornithine N(5)-monooxygenase [NAD(P)H] n=1 Tax=Gonapodya prolifera (strain JEL478) TaxID=1344416 RepID=A0A139ARU9_GONPJ|nr:FAD/NAD(P)-binding domain-containing protein [Gonapodya prolifera JEL478]|eukprot:KXS19471.1 FAD/NAD(P)-binding domain-containing protein [Gonapodya prolifera JEL478]